MNRKPFQIRRAPPVKLTDKPPKPFDLNGRLYKQSPDSQNVKPIDPIQLEDNPVEDDDQGLFPIFY